jgi:hypothetical protein
MDCQWRLILGLRLGQGAPLDGEQIPSRAAAVLALLAQRGKGVFAVDVWKAPALDVIVAACRSRDSLENFHPA